MPVTKSIQRSALTVSEGRKKERSNHQKVFDKKKKIFWKYSQNARKNLQQNLSKVASVESRLFLGILFS